jgi:23S rRNA (cytidine1920-2'-O)/16S rRNA (cytidine1409-2'-O)-methyltransferase
VTVAEVAGVSRERAQALIMAGRVSVDGRPVTKSGTAVATDARVEVVEDPGFVSRGGAKLERALDVFGWAVSDLACLDVGASTGGFTDCLLQRGAASVTSVDVGYGQLAWRLRNDPRVHVVERCNFRLADVASLGAPFDFVCADVSFISLAKLAAKFREALRLGGRFIALVKPQFEAGRSAVGKGGVVREKSAHVAAIESVAGALHAAGIEPVSLTYSPLKGPAGNIEFLVGAIAGADDDGASKRPAIDAAGVVDAAHESLGP